MVSLSRPIYLCKGRGGASGRGPESTERLTSAATRTGAICWFPFDGHHAFTYSFPLSHTAPSWRSISPRPPSVSSTPSMSRPSSSTATATLPRPKPSRPLSAAFASHITVLCATRLRAGALIRRSARRTLPRASRVLQSLLPRSCCSPSARVHLSRSGGGRASGGVRRARACLVGSWWVFASFCLHD